MVHESNEREAVENAEEEKGTAVERERLPQHNRLRSRKGGIQGSVGHRVQEQKGKKKGHKHRGTLAEREYNT